MSFGPGVLLGPYEVVAFIGAGGMGEVWRARDTRLARDVALKILPESFASDPDRLARFEREARLLASLNHPNIGAIYGFEERALVLELVEGGTLADRIALGPIPLESARPIIRQIVEALDAAHERGIVHRDLKPSNIKVRDDGTVKLLDFGLAKLLEPESAVHLDPAAPLATTRANMTQVGLVLGTAAYMSPEQARGQPIDRRTDIWAFGCVLYEMLTGRSVFARPSVPDTVAAILEREPDWSALPASTPASVRRLLGRCFEKDRRQRLRDIGDARADLAGDDTTEPHADRQSGLSVARVAAVATLAALLGAASMWWMSRSHVRVPEPSRIVRLTNGPGREFAPAISPDRKWVAYVAASPTGRTDVWVRFVSGGNAINLTESADLDITANTGIGGLAIAPEGNRIAVMAKRRGSAAAFSTWEVPAPLPGVPRKLLDDGMLGARWSPDGRRLTFIRAGSSAGDALWIADADGTSRREIITAAAGLHIHWPAWSGDGYVYFIRTRSTIANLDQSDIYRIRVDGGTPEPVIATPRRAMFPMVAPGDGGIFFASDAASVDLGLYWRPVAGGTPVPITRGIGDYSGASLSLDGRAIVATYAELRQSLVRFTPTGTGVDEQRVTDGYSGDLDPTISPRANRLVFSSSRGGSRSIWSSELDGAQPRPLTSGDVLDQWPSISPDGSAVAFVSDRGGHRGIWLISSEGGSPRRIVEAESIGGLSWTRDGRAILYAADHAGWPALFKVAVADGQVRRLPTTGVATDPACSPSDETVAYMSPRTTGASFTELRFVDFEGNVRFGKVPSAPPLPSGFANGVLAWSPDGRRLAIVSQNANAPASIWVIEPAAAEPKFQKLVELSPAPRIRGIVWTPDGRSLIVGKHDAESDIVLIELRP
jgi:eukaryotic-like serine/threonine-protein kinase